MHFPLSFFLVAVAGVIALPVSKIGLDPQTTVQRELEVREPQVSLWFQVVSFSQINRYTTDCWSFDKKNRM